MRHLGTVTLQARRLILRRYRLQDAEDMVKNWVRDPEVARFWSWEPHKDMAETISLLKAWIDQYDNMDYYHWVITEKLSGRAIGYIYLTDLDEEEASASVHYLIAGKYQNQGYASEALGKVIGFALKEMGCESICSWHHEENPASGRVMEKCGMQFEKSLYRELMPQRLSGVYRYYRISKV